MACGPATDFQQDLGECSAPQAEMRNNSTNKNFCGAPEEQSSQKKWNKPVKLNLGLLLQPHSASKMTQRQLFAPRRDVMKDVQNKTAARKTLSVLPRHGPSSTRRPSETYKAQFVKPKIPVYRSRPSVGQSQNPSNRRDSKMYHRKTQGLVAPNYTRNTQKIYASSSNEGSSKIPTSRTQEQRNPTTNLASRKGKVMGHIPEVENLENSVNLLNVDDIEEKLMKESSLLKSQILKQIHKDKGEINSGDMKNEQKKILEGQTAMNEKLKHMDEKLDKTLQELTNLKEMIKNLCSNTETLRRNCKCGSATINNLEKSPEKNNYCSDSETKTYSLRRSLRLNNKGALYAYESLRKSTKLLTTPRDGSARKTTTPGRLTRKVIAQLNDLYVD